MGKHALFSPSKADRWLRCALSVKMSALYPETTSAAALEGTKQHEIAAQHLIDGTDSDNPKMQLYLNTVRDYGGEMFIEHKVTIIPEYCYGTADAIIVMDGSLTVIDLKWGTSTVNPINNSQLMLYALGFLKRIPHTDDTEVTLGIVQPNGKAGWPVRRWNTDVKTLLEFRGRVEKAVERGLQDDPSAMAGKHCFWCPAKLHCPEHLYSIGSKTKKALI